MIFAAAVLLTVGAIAFTLFVREKDVPPPEPGTGYEHLEQRKARIYENLRDLHFEFRVGKLSEADYRATRQGLQAELAETLGEIDKVKNRVAPGAPAAATRAPLTGRKACPHCGAKFPAPMKYCGECGKAIA